MSWDIFWLITHSVVIGALGSLIAREGVDPINSVLLFSQVLGVVIRSNNLVSLK